MTENEQDFPTDYMKASPLSRNHITSPTDLYNNLVDFIEVTYQEVYPEDQYWDQITVFEMIAKLYKSALYEKKYNDLLTDNLKHSQEMSANLLTSILEATNLIEEVDPIHKQKKEEMETIKDLLETFKAKNEDKPSPNRETRKARFKNNHPVEGENY